MFWVRVFAWMEEGRWGGRTCLSFRPVMVQRESSRPESSS